jgi:hypothetical protein
MEELAAASFGDVFGAPLRFARTAPADYAEVFGGVAASCSIPYLDLPSPASAGGDGEYGEIFARFDFAGPEELVEEIGSSSGTSRCERCPHSRIPFSTRHCAASALLGVLILLVLSSRKKQKTKKQRGLGLLCTLYSLFFIINFLHCLIIVLYMASSILL